MYFSSHHKLTLLFLSAEEEEVELGSVVDLSASNDGGSNDTTTNDAANEVLEQESEDDTDGSAKPSKSGIREKFQAGTQSVAARQRKGRKYVVAKTSTTASIDPPKPKNKGPKISEGKLAEILKKSYDVTKVVGPKGNKTTIVERVDLSKEPYFEWSNGYALCTCCNTTVPKKQLGQHCATDLHKGKRDKKAKEDADDTNLGKKAQARLRKENLQGSTIDQKDNLILLRGLARGNVALNAASDMAVSYFFVHGVEFFLMLMISPNLLQLVLYFRPAIPRAMGRQEISRSSCP